MYFRFAQYLDEEGTRRVGLSLENQRLARLHSTDSVYALAHRGFADKRTLTQLAEEFQSEQHEDWNQIVADERALSCIDHPVLNSDCQIWADDGGLRQVGDGSLIQAQRAVGLLDGGSQLTVSLLAAYGLDSHQRLRPIGFALAHRFDDWRALQLSDQLCIGFDTRPLAGETTLTTDTAQICGNWYLELPSAAELADLEARTATMLELSHSGHLLLLHIADASVGGLRIDTHANVQICTQDQYFDCGLHSSAVTKNKGIAKISLT